MYSLRTPLFLGLLATVTRRTLGLQFEDSALHPRDDSVCGCQTITYTSSGTWYWSPSGTLEPGFDSVKSWSTGAMSTGSWGVDPKESASSASNPAAAWSGAWESFKETYTGPTSTAGSSGIPITGWGILSSSASSASSSSTTSSTSSGKGWGTTSSTSSSTGTGSSSSTSSGTSSSKGWGNTSSTSSSTGTSSSSSTSSGTSSGKGWGISSSPSSSSTFSSTTTTSSWSSSSASILPTCIPGFAGNPVLALEVSGSTPTIEVESAPSSDNSTTVSAITPSTSNVDAWTSNTFTWPGSNICPGAQSLPISAFPTGLADAFGSDFLLVECIGGSCYGNYAICDLKSHCRTYVHATPDNSLGS